VTGDSSQVELVIVDQLVRSCEGRIAHRRAWKFWERTSNALLALIGIAGALTGGSAIAEKTVAAVILGVAAAVLSGLNVGLRPASLAALNHTAFVNYGDVLRTLEQLLIDRASGDRRWLATLPDINKKIKEVEASVPNVEPNRCERRAARDHIDFLLTGTDSSDARPVTAKERRSRRNSLIGAVLVLLAVSMLVAGVGASVVWIALVIVSIAVVVIDGITGRRGVQT